MQPHANVRADRRASAVSIMHGLSQLPMCGLRPGEGGAVKYRVGERAVAGRQLDQISIGAASRIHTSARFRFTRSGTLTDELQRDSEITANH